MTTMNNEDLSMRGDAPLVCGETERKARAMLIARLENMQSHGDRWLTVESVLGLLNDCDMLAEMEGTMTTMNNEDPAGPVDQLVRPLVERLRGGVYGLARIELCSEAADEIERLSAALAELVALKDMKDRLTELHEMGHGTDYGNYHKRLPLAWAAARAALSAQPEQTAAARDVLAERRRQIEVEGYDTAHDDSYVNDEIAALACFYAMPPGAREWCTDSTGYGDTLGEAIIPEGWSANEGDRRVELVKAGALILAEIERLDRAPEL